MSLVQLNLHAIASHLKRLNFAMSRLKIVPCPNFSGATGLAELQETHFRQMAEKFPKCTGLKVFLLLYTKYSAHAAHQTMTA